MIPRPFTLELTPLLQPARMGLAAEALGPLFEVGFDRVKGGEALARYVGDHGLEELLDASAPRHGGLIARPRLLYPDAPGRWTFYATALDGHRRALLLDDKAVPVFAEGLRALSDPSSEAAAATRRLLGAPFDAWLRALAPSAAPGARPRPGLYRGPHAQLFLQAREAAIVIDPVGLGALPNMSRAGLDLPRVDAVAFTHGHGDHFHLASLLAAARTGSVPVICPRVERRSLLTRTSFAEQLERCGQTVIEPRWGDRLSIGDIQIEVLPFFGEQPTRDAPGAPDDVRNAGNTYWLETPDLRVAVLADAGVDPMGSIEDAVAEVSRRRGPPDVVLACLRTFPCPFFGGLSEYWLTLSFDRLRALHGQWRAGTLPPVTLGPRGLARLAHRCGARAVAAYAHGLPERGTSIEDIGWGEGEPSEAEVVTVLERELRAAGASAEVVRWHIGDRLDVVTRRLRSRA